MANVAATDYEIWSRSCSLKETVKWLVLDVIAQSCINNLHMVGLMWQYFVGN